MHSIDPLVTDAHPRRKPLLKIIIALVLAVGFFGAGIVVGRQSDNYKTGQQSALDYSTVDKVYSLLQKDFDGNLDKTRLLDGIKSGLVSATGDPYTTYFNPKEAQSFEEQLAGSFSGIGAELGSDKDKRIVIVSPLAGYPAAKAGLKSKDVVAAVDGKPTSGQTVDQIVQKIRGPENTQVKLTIVRGNGKPFVVPITRTKIKIASVKSKIEGKVGYLQITQFSDDTAKLAQAAAQTFKDKGVKAVILDLRGDPGGYLDAAVKLSSLWLDTGQTVVQEKRGGEIINTLTASGDNLLKGLPTVVLIDGGSASASEITAGALRDNKDATLVGLKSFGKGSVQTVEKLADGSEVKITVARWFTPDGKNIDKEGITPDVVVKAGSGDPQKAKALQLLNSKIH